MIFIVKNKEPYHSQDIFCGYWVITCNQQEEGGNAKDSSNSNNYTTEAATY